MSLTRKSFRPALGIASLILVAPILAACGGADATSSTSTNAKAETGESAQPTEPAVQISSNVKSGAAAVKVNKLVTVSADKGTFQNVTLRTAKGVPVAGGLNPAKTEWKATARLEPGKNYVVRAVGKDADGLTTTFRSKFSTQNLTLDQQTYASVSPTDGATVGVGMPIQIRFDIPVKNRANFERHMKVTSSAGQVGSFYWIDDQTVHYRPKEYWQAGSKISVDLDLNSVDAGNGIYGQESRKVNFSVGDAMISKVNIQTHQMQVFKNGKLIRTIPITTGEQPKFTTRSGIKVIVEQFRTKRMNSETIGIDPDSPDGYDLNNVEYAQRLTYSGEFVHAAPWSVGSQGNANVSHGCTGMSTANAEWFYYNSRPGDVMDFTGSDKGMTMTNGYGDWNTSWADWQKGSAL